MNSHRRLSRRVWLLLLSGAVVLALAVVVPSARLAIRRAGTSARLQHIQMALRCYEDAYGCYPPQYLTDQEGRPAHSWRVLLLPYLGEEELYRRYRFDEPWNGPHNRLLAAETPFVYRSPFLGSKSTITQYVGIAGKDTPWQGAYPMRNDDLMRGWGGFDSQGNEVNPLIWFVEAANSDIIWMEPRDIPLEQAVAGVNVPGGRGIQSNYSEDLPAQRFPLSGSWVPTGMAPDALRAMLTTGKHDGSPTTDAQRPPDSIPNRPAATVDPGPSVP